MNIEEDKIYVNKKDGMFVHVKEITRYLINPTIASVVCGTDTQFRCDSKTTVMRAVWSNSEFLDRYVEEKKTLSDKKSGITQLYQRSIDDHSFNFTSQVFMKEHPKLIEGIYYDETDVKEALKELEERTNKLFNNAGVYLDLIQEIFGKELLK